MESEEAVVDWFVSVWDEGADVHVYRGGEGLDRDYAIDQVVAADKVIAFP